MPVGYQYGKPTLPQQLLIPWYQSDEVNTCVTSALALYWPEHLILSLSKNFPKDPSSLFFSFLMVILHHELVTILLATVTIFSCLFLPHRT